MTPRYASITQFSEYLGITPRTAWKWIAAGRIKAYRFGPQTVRVDLNEVDALAVPNVPSPNVRPRTKAAS